jgi:hypothetical protein
VIEKRPKGGQKAHVRTKVLFTGQALRKKAEREAAPTFFVMQRILGAKSGDPRAKEQKACI